MDTNTVFKLDFQSCKNIVISKDRIINANPIVKAFTFGWSDHINQHKHTCAFHSGLVLGELLCGIIYTALGYNNTFILLIPVAQLASIMTLFFLYIIHLDRVLKYSLSD